MAVDAACSISGRCRLVRRALGRLVSLRAIISGRCRMRQPEIVFI
jgi:hypothetical protein